MVKKSTNALYVSRPIRSSGSTEGALEEADERNETSSQRRRQNELKHGRGAESDEAGHRQGGGIVGCSSGVVCTNHLVRSESCEGMRTHPHPRFEYPLGKPLEAKRNTTSSCRGANCPFSFLLVYARLDTYLPQEWGACAVQKEGRI